MTSPRLLIGSSLLAVARAQAGLWAAPLCFKWPLFDANEQCEAFVFGVGIGTCAEGHQAAWLTGVCEAEHAHDDHDHADVGDADHAHWTNFEHPPPPSPAPPPPAPLSPLSSPSPPPPLEAASGEDASGDAASGEDASGDAA